MVRRTTARHGSSDGPARHGINAKSQSAVRDRRDGITEVAHRAIGRVATLPLAWLVAAFTLAQLADLVSALVVARELDPIAASIVGRPLLALALKTALVALVVAVADICDRRRPLLARVVLLIGAVAGLFVALSNTHLTPFVTG